MDQFIENLPLPAQLGIIGVLILWNILTLRAQNKRVQEGNLVPILTVEEERKAAREKYDEMVILKDQQIAEAREGKTEWKTTADAAAERNGVLAGALDKSEESNQLSDHFFRTYMPKLTPVNPAAVEPTKEGVTS